MPFPPTGNSSIGSSSSFSSSKSSLLNLPVDEASSQSDVADFVSMPRGDSSAYGIAASPEHAATKASLSLGQTASATQKIKRVFKRRRPSQDATAVLSTMSSADEPWRTDSEPRPVASASNQLSAPATTHSTPSRPSAAKLTMNLFGRKHVSTDGQPPPLPPKPPRPPPPAIRLNTTSKPARPRSSVMIESASINAAIEYMRDTEAERHRFTENDVAKTPMDVPAPQASPESKEDWRKSNSTMDSGHTVRPTNPSESGSSSKRTSAYLASPTNDGTIDLLEFLAGAPHPDRQRPDRHADAKTGKQSKRRSLSLNIHMPLSHTASTALTHPVPPAPLSTPGLPSAHNPYNQLYSLNSTAPHPANPTITRTPASHSDTFENSANVKTNIRDRLVAWTAVGGGNRTPSPSPSQIAAASTSSPSLLLASNTPLPLHIGSPSRTPVTSDASQGEIHAIDAVRRLRSRVRSPSNSSISNAAGIRQAATSLTSGAGAMAFGLGKRAYEKVNRVWGSQSNASGSGSDTPSFRHPSPVPTPSPSNSNNNIHGPHNNQFGPSSFPLPRRTPNASSGTWSIPSQTGSRSSSERDNGRDATSVSGAPGALGRLVRPPRINGPTSGVVFGRQLWECVKDTRAPVIQSPSDPLSGRMIPALVYRCVKHLHQWGFEEEGLFRINGRNSHITRLRQEFDGGADYDIIDCTPSELDPHAVSSVFKAYLRELPEPILTKALSPLFDNAISAENTRAISSGMTGALAKTVGQNGPSLPTSPTGPRPMPIPMLRKPPSLSTFTLPTSSSLRAPSTTLIETLSHLVSRLPRENYDLLLTVVELIKATAAHSKQTKMPLSNLLLVFCPSLHMVPTLLRTFCDAPEIWERISRVLDGSKVSMEKEEEDTKSARSDSSSDIEYEDQNLVPLSSNLKGKGGKIIDEDHQQDISNDSVAAEKAAPTPETIEISADQDVILVPISRKLRGPRRLPDLPVRNGDKQACSPIGPSNRPSTPTLTAESASTASDPTSSKDTSSASCSLSSAQASEVSLISSEGKAFPDTLANVPSASASSSSASVPLGAQSAAAYDKSLPASPRSPHTTDYAQKQMDALEALTRAAMTHTPGNYSTSAPHLAHLDNNQAGRSGSLPTPLIMASKSAPSVVFPTINTAPSTPISLKRHALTMSSGRHHKISEGEDGALPSPSKRMTRRPSLNLLFNMKRGGSPSPRSRTPTISSPLQCSPTMMHTDEDETEELSPIIMTDPSPPVLSLRMESGLESGWSWDDVFGGSLVAEVVSSSPQSQHFRTAAISQPSAQLPASPSSHSPPSPLRRPTTEYLLTSGGFFSSKGPPTVLPSAMAVLEAAESCDTTAGIRPSGSISTVPSSPDNTSSIPQEDNSSGDDSPTLSSPKEPISLPPLIDFPLRGSSFDEEDWAGAVLMAAGKPADLSP